MCFVLFAFASKLARNHPKPQPSVTLGHPKKVSVRFWILRDITYLCFIVVWRVVYGVFNVLAMSLN